MFSDNIPKDPPEITGTISPAKPIDLETHTLHVANLLQSTLDLTKLIELFSQETAQLLPHCGLHYGNSQDNVEITVGEPGDHRATYDLVLMEQSLGRLTLSRDEPIEPAELRELESLICALIYPLRNALLYKRALDTALTDPVTGINNRAAMNANLDREINLAHRHGNPLSLIMLDIDRFKQINDSYGHIAGDVVLKALAECVTECTRSSDIVFRYGGEEFAILLSNTEGDGASLLANRIRVAVEGRAVKHESAVIRLTVSVGVATLERGDGAADILEKADQALYQAKQEGRNRVVNYDA
jgi:diguanylate cyclase (GGDEF)-like protein